MFLDVEDTNDCLNVIANVGTGDTTTSRQWDIHVSVQISFALELSKNNIFDLSTCQTLAAILYVSILVQLFLTFRPKATFSIPYLLILGNPVSLFGP